MSVAGVTIESDRIRRSRYLWLDWVALGAWAAMVIAAALPATARLTPRPWWGLAAAGAYGVSHALVLASALLLIAGLLLRPRPFLSRWLGALAGGLGVLFVAVDARLYSLTGQHLDGNTFGHILQPRALTTLGIERGDLTEVALLLAVVVVVGGWVLRRRPPAVFLLRVGLFALGADVLFTGAEALARFKGVEALYGMNELLPLQWRPRGQRLLSRVLNQAPARVLEDYDFPEPEPRPPEQFTLVKRPLPRTAERTPDILIVVVESLRADALPLAPRLQRFAAENTLGLRHYSGGNCTFLGVFTLLSALDPSYWLARNTDRAPQGLSAFHALGYQLQLKSSTLLDHDVAVRVAPPAAFTLLPSSPLTPPQRDDEAIEEALRWASTSAAQPRLLVLFLEATHWPYFLNDGSAKPGDFADVKAQNEEYRQRYQRSVAEMDVRIGRLLDGLAQVGDPSNRVVLITGDHGEAFYEHGMAMHGRRLDEEQVRVPVALALPGVPPRTLPGPSTHQDLLPTLLDYLGATPRASSPGQGVSLLKGEPRASAPLLGACGIQRTSGYAAVDGDRKLLLQIDRNGVEYFGRVEKGDVGVNDLTQDAWVAAELVRQREAARALLVPQ